MAVVGQRVGKQILEALGLPSERCVSFELRIAVNEFVTVKAEYHAEGDPDAIAEVFRGFMVNRQKEGDIALSDLPDKHPSFADGSAWGVQKVELEPGQSRTGEG